VTRRLLLTYLTITAFALVVVVVPLGLTFASRERDRFVFDIERDAQAVGSRAEDDLEAGTEPDLSAVFDAYDVEGARILVVDADGRSVADSSPAVLGRSYGSRPEIAEALSGQRAAGQRWSNTLDTRLQYVAVPVASQGRILGAVRITVPSSTVDERVRETWWRLAALSAVVLATVGAVGLILARSVTRPVLQLDEAARRLASGDLDARVGAVEGAPELARLAEQFDATADRLQQMVDAQRRFVGDASHQLRTPLAALRLRLETMQTAPGEEATRDAAIAEVDRLSRLVQSLLELARSTDAEPVVTEVDLRPIVDERRDAWLEAARAREIDLVVLGPSSVSAVAVDGAVEQVLDNLIANALAVAPAGSTIELALDPGPTATTHGPVLRVTDQGPGLPPDQRARATSRFWRAPDAPPGGTGLGLAIVDHLVMAGGGHLELEAGPGGVGLRATVAFAPPGTRDPAPGQP
jgi:signal transduction histidine kinase